jgi:uncharacterized membrane protein YphA (DoxX/SURF4 family)
MNGTTQTADTAEHKVIDSVYWTLRLSFGLVPLLAGLDKFLNLLTQWPKYLAPALAHALPVTPQSFMHLVGIIEIVAGLAVLLTPWTKVFAYVVAAWLAGIAINLVAAGYYDVAVRDLVMAVTAISLARLTSVAHAALPRRALREAHVGTA